ETMSRRQRGNQTDEGDVVASITQPPRHFERHETTEGVATQEIRAFRLPRFHSGEVFVSHRLDGCIGRVTAIQAACLNADHRPGPGHFASQTEQLHHAATYAVDEKQRGRTLTRLQNDE